MLKYKMIHWKIFSQPGVGFNPIVPRIGTPAVRKIGDRDAILKLRIC